VQVKDQRRKISIVGPFPRDAHGIKTHSFYLGNFIGKRNFNVTYYDTSLTRSKYKTAGLRSALDLLEDENKFNSDLIIFNIGNGPMSYLGLLLSHIIKGLTIVHDGKLVNLVQETLPYFQNKVTIANIKESKIDTAILSKIIGTSNEISKNYKKNTFKKNEPYLDPVFHTKGFICPTNNYIHDYLLQSGVMDITKPLLLPINKVALREVREETSIRKFGSIGILDVQKDPAYIGELFGRLSRINSNYEFYWVGHIRCAISLSLLFHNYISHGGNLNRLKIIEENSDSTFNTLVGTLDVVFLKRAYSNFESSGTILQAISNSAVVFASLLGPNLIYKSSPVIEIKKGEKPLKTINNLEKFLNSTQSFNALKRKSYNWSQLYQSRVEKDMDTFFTTLLNFE
jgi:hypothetical protein